MDKVRVGIVGSGYMALTYAEALKHHVKDSQLAAIAGGSRAPQLAAGYAVDACSTVEELAARADIDAVIVATPDQLHRQHSVQAANRGKHVLVEKPMAPTVAQCNEMIAAAQANRVRLAVVKTERYRTLTKRAKAFVKQGELGAIWMMRTLSCFPKQFGKEILDTRPWYKDPASSGLFASMAAHNADLILWLCNCRAVQVFAQATTFSDLDVPTQSVMAQIRFESGAMAQMWISSEMPSPGMPSSEVRTQVVGSKGTLDFENYEFLDLGKDNKWERIFVPEQFDWVSEPTSPVRLEPHIGVVQEFVNCIVENRTPAEPGEVGRAAVEICEAAVLSAQRGQAVDLPLASG